MSYEGNPRGGWFRLAMKNGWGSWCAEFANDKSTCSRVEYDSYIREGYVIEPIVVMSYSEMDALIARVKEEAVAQYQHNLAKDVRKRAVRPAIEASVAVEE